MVLPEIRALIDAVPAEMAPPDASVEVVRASADSGVIATHRFVRPPGVSVDAEDTVVDAGDGPVPVRVYRAGDAAAGVHVHLHGGGWWMGSIETTDPMARELAAATGLTVVSVGYRLAPEHPWPAAVNDAYAAVAWAADELRGTGTVSVGGESAGANIAAVVALMCRDRGGPDLAGQWLDVPAVDLTMPEDESLRSFGSGFGLEIAAARVIVDWYVADERRRDPYVSPAFASLEGLPRALVTTAEFDPLRDQGERYAAALGEVGVDVTAMRAEGHIHASSWLTGLTASSGEWHDRVCEWLVATHAGARVS